MAQQNAPLASLLSVVDAAGVAMAPPAERLDGTYMDAGNYSRSWTQPMQRQAVAGSEQKMGFKQWLLLRWARITPA